MTSSEFLNQFNVLYNNQTSNQAPDLNGYEISVFLTKAEYEIFKNYFSPKGNKYQDGIDDSPKRQIDFSRITKELEFENISKNAVVISDELKDVMFILNEEATESDNKKYIVVPLSYQEYNRLQSKPYKYPLRNQVWRIISGGETNSIIKFISHYNKSVKKYNLRYIKFPNPIIVEDDTIWSEDWDGKDLTIGGWPKKVESSSEEPDTPDYENEDPVEQSTILYPDIEAPEELHEEILQRAVELAKITWLGDLTATLTGGQRSE